MSNRRSQAALDATSDCIVLVEADGRVVAANAAAAAFVGGADPHADRLLVGVVHPGDQDQIRAWLADLAAGIADGRSVRFRAATPAGEWRLLEAVGTNRLAEPDVQALVIGARDITEEAASVARSLRGERLYEVLVETNDSCLPGASLDATFFRACRSATRAGGFKMAWIGEVVGGAVVARAVAGAGAEYVRGLSILVSEHDPRGRGPTGTAARVGQTDVCNDILGEDRLRPWWDPAVRFGFAASIAVPIAVDGEVRGVFSVYSSVTDAFDDAGIALLEMVASNLARHWESADRASCVSPEPSRPDAVVSRAPAQQRRRIDQLTGVADREGARKWLSHELRRLAVPNDLTVLMVDIDRFHQVNQELGGEGGDRILQQAARRLAAVVRCGDLVARVSGDEFLLAMVCPTGSCGADELTQRIGDLFRSPLPGLTRPLTVGVGVATARDGNRTPDDLIQRAGVALREAKRRGPGGLVHFNGALADVVDRRTRIEHDLAVAVERRQLTVLYQPIVDLSTGVVVGAEALVRWRHAQLGPISPDEFIALAEGNGLIIPIGRYVLREAVKALASWSSDSAPPLYVTVNVSPRQFADPDFLSTFDRVVAEARGDRARLRVEITETALAADAEQALRTVRQLRERNVAVAIDDFGTGYSSLNQLRHLPIDAIKLDRSFVRGLPDEPADAAVCKAVVSLAQAMGLSVIAEGVESEAQRLMLDSMGCAFGQGYLWSPAIPGDRLLALATRRRCG